MNVPPNRPKRKRPQRGQLWLAQNDPNYYRNQQYRQNRKRSVTTAPRPGKSAPRAAVVSSKILGDGPTRSSLVKRRVEPA